MLAVQSTQQCAGRILEGVEALKDHDATGEATTSKHANKQATGQQMTSVVLSASRLFVVEVGASAHFVVRLVRDVVLKRQGHVVTPERAQAGAHKHTRTLTSTHAKVRNRTHRSARKLAHKHLAEAIAKLRVEVPPVLELEVSLTV